MPPAPLPQPPNPTPQPNPDPRLYPPVSIPRIFSSVSSSEQLHGRTKQQHYYHTANWNYIDTCAQTVAPLPFFGQFSGAAHCLDAVNTADAVFAAGCGCE